MRITPRRLAFGMSLWPSNLFSGIRVLHVSDDWTSADVQMTVNLFTRNYVKTGFGGTMSAMTDPYFFMLVMHQLGRDHIVWDTRGEIEFKKPGRGRLRAHFEVSPQVVDDIRRETADGSRHLRTFETDIVDEAGDVVAHVVREVYVRLKDRVVSGPSAPGS